MARVWNLAPSVMSAIRLHHDFDMLGERDTQAEVQTLVAAERVMFNSRLASAVRAILTGLL